MSFNGKQLNWNVWTCEQGTRRNAYNDPDDSYLDGQGHLILRVRKAADGKYHLGFIRTQQEFSVGLLRSPRQPGHGPRLLECLLALGQTFLRCGLQGSGSRLPGGPTPG